MSLIRCAVCHKAGLEDDFVYVPVDEQHEKLMCFSCAPEDAMRQTWPVDEQEESDYNDGVDSDAD